ncbi:MAG: hypothetical protein ACYC63_19855 [Armatimonadota bacterium]
MSDRPITERQHRQDEHRGLPVATRTRNGYMTAEDKRLLDALRAAGHQSAAAHPTATTATATASTIDAIDKAIAEVKAMIPTETKDLSTYLLADGSRDLTGNLSTSASAVLIDGVKLHAHRHSGNLGAGDGVQVYHNTLLSLDADDHAQYHNNTRGDARYSLLAHLHAATYAPIAKGVTNGDLHDHDSGDGGQINHGVLSGLLNDVHTHYHTDARGDARYSLTAHLHTGVYAPTAKGVTNGDSHHHGGAGDGGLAIKHGDLADLGLDTHSQYHNDARADARYALLAAGVTNGNSHDHSGGDGAQIAYSGLAGFIPQVRVTAAQFDKTATVGLSAITGLTTTIPAGAGTYKYRAVLHWYNSGGVGGVKFSVALATSTPASALYQVQTVDNATNAFVTNTRGTDVGGTAGVGVSGQANGMTIIEGTVTITSAASAAGTLAIRFAQQVSNATASSVLAGSSFEVKQTN